MFLKQLDQFMLQYYSFKAENIAKQQKCWELWQYTWRHKLQLGLDCDVMQEVSYPFILQSMMLPSMIFNDPKNTCSIILKRKRQNTGIHGELKIVF
jgi:hypothetical protein